MKRSAVMAGLAAILAPGGPLLAQVSDDATGRIPEYTDRALDFVPEGSESYAVKRLGKPLADSDLASLSGDPDLQARVQTNTIRSRLYRSEIGLLAIPLGVLIGIDNFFGNRTTRLKQANLELPPSVFAPYPADDLRSFLLSAGGAALAIYGAWQVGELLGEAIGTYRPVYLGQEEAREAVKEYNRKLALDLGLEPSQIATVTLPASPSPTPPVFAEEFPAGAEGTGGWAIRKAMAAVHARVGSDWRPFLAYTRDIHDFVPGLVDQGDWHVVMAATGSVRDLDVTVPRHAGGPTWVDAGPEWTAYRAGTDLVHQTKVDSPRALELLQPEYVERQVGWLKPGSTVVLYPFYFRLEDPVWIVHLAGAALPAFVGINARTGNLVNLSRYR